MVSPNKDNQTLGVLFQSPPDFVCSRDMCLERSRASQLLINEKRKRVSKQLACRHCDKCGKRIAFYEID